MDFSPWSLRDPQEVPAPAHLGFSQRSRSLCWTFLLSCAAPAALPCTLLTPPAPPSHPSFPSLIPSQHRGSGTPDPPKTRTAVQPWAGQECGIPFPPCPRCQIPLRAQPVPGLVSGGFPTIPAALGCGCHGNPTSPAPSLLLRGSSCILRETLPCSPSHFWHCFTSRLLQTRHCRAG